MGTRVDLPGGGWADIKDPDQLTNRDRKVLRRHAMGARIIADKLVAAGGVPGTPMSAVPADVMDRFNAALTADDMELTDAAQAAFIVSYTSAWSLDRPLPTMDTVDDLPGPVYDALAAATTALGDGTPDLSPDGAVDPGSPTVPSPG